MKEIRYLFISGHDFRSKRKASIHFIASHFARHGKVRFFSAGFSFLSHLKKDPRSDLDGRANVVETTGGVDAFLQKSWLHPFRLPLVDGLAVTRWWMKFHALGMPRTVRRWVEEADVIVLESGFSLVYFSLIKEINPGARLVYSASDRLSTIGCSVQLEKMLQEAAPQFDVIRVPSPVMLDDFGADARVVVIPHGFDPPGGDRESSNPYSSGGINAVSVGSMLFDADLFRMLCPAAPQVHFHVIGAGVGATGLDAPNLTVYDEMPFEQTRGYIEHADVGIAPYRADRVSPYLSDTSLKLVQFAASGLPAICPAAAVGTSPYRFGYEPDRVDSVSSALDAALAFGRFAPVVPPSWAEVGDRLLAELPARADELAT